MLRYVVPFGREFASADGLRHLPAVGALADAIGDRPFADFVPHSRRIVIGARLLLALRAGLRGWLATRVARTLMPAPLVGVAQLAVDGDDALGGAPEQALLVFDDLRRCGRELGLRCLTGDALGLELVRQLLGGGAPAALVLGRHERALIMFRRACPSIPNIPHSKS